MSFKHIHRHVSYAAKAQKKTNCSTPISYTKAEGQNNNPNNILEYQIISHTYTHARQANRFPIDIQNPTWNGFEGFWRFRQSEGMLHRPSEVSRLGSSSGAYGSERLMALIQSGLLGYAGIEILDPFKLTTSVTSKASTHCDTCDANVSALVLPKRLKPV